MSLYVSQMRSYFIAFLCILVIARRSLFGVQAMQSQDLLWYLDVDVLAIDRESLSHVHVVVLGTANLRLQVLVHDLRRLGENHYPTRYESLPLRLSVDRLLHEAGHLDYAEVLHDLVPLPSLGQACYLPSE